MAGPLFGKTIERAALVVVIALAVAAYFLLGLDRWFSLSLLKTQLETLTAYSKAHPLISMGAYFIAYVLTGALSIPGALLRTMLAGALFGFVVGTILTWIGSAFGALLAFLIARFVLRDWVGAHFADKLAVVNAGIARDGKWYLLALWLIPAFPFFLVNLLMGLTAISVRTFFWVSLIGLLPATALYVNAGTRLAQIETLNDVLSPAIWGGLALLGVLPLLARQALKRRPRI